MQYSRGPTEAVISLFLPTDHDTNLIRPQYLNEDMTINNEPLTQCWGQPSGDVMYRYTYKIFKGKPSEVEPGISASIEEFYTKLKLEEVHMTPLSDGFIVTLV